MNNSTSYNPLVSVIVPVLNREDLVLKTLDSIASQTYRPIELIVVDNGSKDRSYQNVEEWMSRISDPHLTVRLLKEEKPGATAARNCGLKESKGEYINFFDSDDQMRPNLIEKAIAVLKSEEEADLVCWPCIIHQLDGSDRKPTFYSGSFLESHIIHSLLRPQGYLAKRELFENVGGWNETLQGWNDWELGIRLLVRCPRIVSVDEILAEIYSQKDSITGENFSSKEGIWEKSIDEAEKASKEIDGPLKDKVIKMLIYRRIILAAIYKKEGNIRGAKKLLATVSHSGNPLDYLLLKFAYFYTSKGFRGAWRLIRGLYMR